MVTFSNPGTDISSIYGRIELLLMIYRGNDWNYLDIVLELMRKTPRYTKFIVYCTSLENRKEALAYLYGRNPQQVVEAETVASLDQVEKCVLVSPTDEKSHENYTDWSRDPFFVRLNSNGKTELVERSGLTIEDSSLVETIDAISPLIEAAKEPIEFYVAGGNVLLVGKHILIGHEELKTNVKPGIEWHHLLQNVTEAFGNRFKNKPTETIVVGESMDARMALENMAKMALEFSAAFQKCINIETMMKSLFLHIDTFLTPLGCWEDGKPVLFLAKVETIFTLEKAESSQFSKLVDGVNAYLDAIEIELADSFKIARNPVPMFVAYRYLEVGKVGGVFSRDVYMGHYNNCLVEVTNINRSVWIPQISHALPFPLHEKGVSGIEKRNLDMWEAHGFAAHLIKADFHSYLDRRGALHCLTKELSRGPFTVRAKP